LLDRAALTMFTNAVEANNTPTPLDEDAALEALERLRDQIREARQRREQKVEEFEAWMRAERNALRQERIAALDRERSGGITVPSESGVPEAARSASRATEPLGVLAASTASANRIPANWAPYPEHDRSTAAARILERLSQRRPLAAAAAALALMLIAIVAWSWLSSSSEAPSQPASAAGNSNPAAQAPQSTQPAPAGAQTPAARRPLEVELATTRVVWMRVTVDGERVVEREVPAGQRLRFGADRAIVVRAGDGGGVRLTVDGRAAGVLGRDGQIATRTFTPAARR
jgi:hypothetical protein